MAAIEPNTDFYLIKAPLEMDQLNQIKFASTTEQTNYFSNLPHKLFQHFTYQRHDSTVTIPVDSTFTVEHARLYNYCMYRNSAYDGRWCYAFVTSCEWSSNGSCKLTIETDQWQTWCFDITFGKSFIEREHVNDDTFGKHTIPESLEYGEYVCNGVQHVTYADPTAESGNTRMFIAFQVTTVDVSHDDAPAVFPSPIKNVFNGIPQGCYIFGFPYTADTVGKISTVVGYYDAAGRADAIISIFMIPRVCCDWEIGENGEGVFAGSTDWWIPKYSTSAATALGPQIERNTTIDGYVPHNNKLFCAPYNALYLSNNAGGDCVYQWEMFNGDPTFAVYGALEQGGSITMFPLNSKKSAATATGDGWNEGLPAGKLPLLSWASDYYLNWQAVNGTNMKIQAGFVAANWGINMLSGMAGGSIANTASTTKKGKLKGGQSTSETISDAGGMLGSTLGMLDQVRAMKQQIREASIIPPTAKGNVSSGSIGFSCGESRYTFRKMSIRAEYAKFIDSYFDAFGYRIDDFKIPNITGRRNWNYVKTIGCNIHGDVPQIAIESIKQMFNTGVTIWHNANTFMDYSQDNSII